MDKKYFTYFNQREAEPYIGKECRFANYGTLLSLGKGVIGTLSKIKGDDDYPFACGSVFYQFCTPVEKKLRPYKDFEELAKDAVEHGFKDTSWFKIKHNESGEWNVALRPTGVEVCFSVELGDYFYSFDEMVEHCVWADGTPCGVEEEV